MATNPVRVPEAVHDEVHTAARLFGCNASELLEHAWHSFRQSPEFVTEFEQARKAFSSAISTRSPLICTNSLHSGPSDEPIRSKRCGKRRRSALSHRGATVTLCSFV